MPFQIDEVACFTAAFLRTAFFTHSLEGSRDGVYRVVGSYYITFAVVGTYLPGHGAAAAIAWWSESALATKKTKVSLSLFDGLVDSAEQCTLAQCKRSEGERARTERGETVSSLHHGRRMSLSVRGLEPVNRLERRS
ncbi:uncharacterized protein PV07_12875 [Cladophialophora immunda]|uniref:Uncharacterized protein n=1 Tax=Cladophialophora immunda TaxID=569365 RepID=A0A0D2AA97_9EURO|nr:uncharacterized protein PV07_12875 [Cladophialophora immunda]KIW21692.1 hypothetical protein PV07_12875 [Cladophialophora immunda]